MNIYFGKVKNPEEMYEIETLYSHNGKYYFYRLSFENEQFCIYDTCDRMIPFDYESAVGLANAVYGVNEYIAAREEAKYTFDRRMENLEDFLETSGE